MKTRKLESRYHIPGLPDGLWPLHLQRRPDELLSSWVVRLAHAHLLKAETFCTLITHCQNPIWNRDIDKLAPPDFIGALARAVGVQNSDVMRATLTSYAGWLSEEVNSFGGSRWIMPLGIYHRTRHRFGLVYCPVCLDEPQGQYFRRTWRLAWCVVCTRHRCLMLDRCPRCGEPVAPHRADMSSRTFVPGPYTIVTCGRCRVLLASAVPLRAPNELVRLQIIFEKALSLGHLNWAGNVGLRSSLFFDGVRALSTAVVRCHRYLAALDDKPRLPVCDIEHMTLAGRRQHLEELAYLLERWPEQFLEYVARNGLRYSELHAFLGDLPFWLDSVLQPLKQISYPARTSASTSHEKFPGSHRFWRVEF